MCICLAQSITVKTHVLPACKGCDEWLDTISEVTPAFKNILFETVHVDVLDLKKTTHFPYTTVTMDNNMTLRYTYKKDPSFLRRWLLDISHRRFSLVSNVSAMDEWFNGFSSWMHVLSPEYPRELESLSRRFLSTGFAWTKTNRTRYSNTVLVQPFQGDLRMKFDVPSLKKELRHVLPPVIPVDIARQYPEYVYAFSDQELHVYSNQTLSGHWSQFKMDYPRVAIIQFPEQDEEAVWTQRRSVQFKYPGIDQGVRTWYTGISKGLTAAEYRQSDSEADIIVDGTHELSGDSLWSFVLQHQKALIYEYDEDTLSMCETSMVTDLPLGRLNIKNNDHETLPEASSAGWVHYYLMGRVRKSFRCDNAEQYLQVLHTPSVVQDEL